MRPSLVALSGVVHVMHDMYGVDGVAIRLEER